MTGLTSDLRSATRRLLRRPGFSLLVVATLAVAIASTSAVFRWVDTILWRPLPVSEAQELVRVFASWSDRPDRLSSISHPLFRELEARTDSLISVAAYSDENPLHVTTEGGQPDRATGSLVSGSFFPLLGLSPAEGRLLTPGDDEPGAPPVAVLSHRYWQTAFGGAPGMAGEEILVNGHPFTVVGVVPRSFSGIVLDASSDLWLPLATADLALPAFGTFDVLENPGFVWLGVVGRLAPGAGPARVTQEVNGLLGSLEMETPSGDRARVLPLNETPLHPDDLESAERLSWILVVVVGLVLLLSCAVVASLLLVRGERRRRDLAIRHSLGASKARLIGELLSEGVLLAGAAVTAGIGLAALLDRVALGAWGETILVPSQALDPVTGSRVLAAAILAGGVSVVVGTLYPAWRASAVSPGETLQASSPRATSDGDASLRSALVVAQIALSTVVLVGAVLLLRTLDRVRDQDPGFDPAGRLVASVDLGRQGYDEEAWPRAWERIVGEVRRLPGVVEAGLSQHVPVHPGGSRMGVRPEGYEPAPDEVMSIHLSVVSPGFLEALGTRLLAGRPPREEDGADSRPVVVVNRAFVDRYWPGAGGPERALGRSIFEFPRAGRVEVVGVVDDFKLRSLREPPTPAVFAPLSQFPSSSMSVLVRTAGSPRHLVSELRRAVARFDPALPLFDVETLEKHVGASLERERVLARLLAVFAGVAILLAASGLYSVLAFVTETRRREIGIRMALGAKTVQVVREVVTSGAVLGLAGISLGLLVALVLGGFLESLLYGVPPNDPWSLAITSLALLAVSVAAAALPARRAARVDPMTVLREE